MNTLELIKKQISQIMEMEKSIFLDSIILHLERSEHYYRLGENDNGYYNDVVYRTNQAYEGALKEAFKILASKSESEVIKETPHRIEKYFEENGIFKTRVLELFRNYRNEWRNKSTHDYKLFFDSNEAFIAISSVTSFTYLLLNQIIEKISFEYQMNKIRNFEGEIYRIKEEGLKVAAGLFEIMTLVLADYIDYNDIKTNNPFEAQIIGFLKANFNSHLNFATIKEEVNIGRNLKPDFLIEYQDDKIILEVKKFSGELNIEGATSQLLTYLEYAKIEKGIVLALDFSKDFKPLRIEERIIKSDSLQFTIRIISN